MKHVIAVDLGGTNIRVALVSPKDHTVISAYREPSVHNDNNAAYEQIRRMVKKLIDDNPNDDLSYIGISAAGFVENQVLKLAPNIGLKDFAITSLLEHDFPEMKVLMGNDANCSALSESCFGAAKAAMTSFFITVSSGIGAGLVYNKELIDLPLELGHTYIGYQNRFYELEQLCSGNGIVRLAMINGLSVKNAGEFFALVLNKDKKALSVYDDWTKLFSCFIANIQITYNPDVTIISGGVMKSSKIFMDDIKSVANAFIAPFPVHCVNLVPAAFDQDTGIMGAAAMALILSDKDKVVFD